jgi:RNA polymerase sigma-70 factor (ECF subfamily)
MATGDSTVDLAERIRNADRSAETELAQRFCGRVYAMALVRTRDREAAKDLAQEIMLVVLGALREGRLRDHASLAGYVCATARNRINSFLRTLRDESVVSPSQPIETTRLDPEKAFEDADRRRSARRAIEQLSPADQEILRLTLSEGLQPKAIAARLGLKPEVVRKRRSRAVRRARKAMQRLRVTNSIAMLPKREESR